MELDWRGRLILRKLEEGSTIRESAAAVGIIFLDIDGVMIAYPEGDPTTPVFTLRCVEAFRMILTAFPSAKVVFSTTWRLS